ncbi:hypothetical protein HGRIS_000837 [Hohenbuehelia grisea]|uniref:Ricin B lectin domain-containing protein n=1 Tax=Hohenbuehelia grisea TaxID=104357 RepID=A0ABR3IPX3_9AGAR
MSRVQAAMKLAILYALLAASCATALSIPVVETQDLVLPSLETVQPEIVSIDSPVDLSTPIHVSPVDENPSGVTTDSAPVPEPASIDSDVDLSTPIHLSPVDEDLSAELEETAPGDESQSLDGLPPPEASIDEENPALDDTTPEQPSLEETTDSTDSASAIESPSDPPLLPSVVQLHPDGMVDKCLDVNSNFRFNGARVQIYDCNGSGAQDWVLNFGNTKVQLAGSDYCLDAGNPSDGAHMKLWSCEDDQPNQSWYYTYDYRLAVTGTGQCLDLKGGHYFNRNRVQTWKCTSFNTNQVWTT